MPSRNLRYIRVADDHALHAEWDAVGVPSGPTTGSRLMPPGDTDYGMREFALVDKSGNLIPCRLAGLALRR
jgi:hypothetical protein